jgi:hypothetical protein
MAANGMASGIAMTMTKVGTTTIIGTKGREVGGLRSTTPEATGTIDTLRAADSIPARRMTITTTSPGGMDTGATRTNGLDHPYCSMTLGKAKRNRRCVRSVDRNLRRRDGLRLRPPLWKKARLKRMNLSKREVL